MTCGLADYDKVKEYLEQAVLITEQIGDINGVVASCRMLGTALHFLDDYSKAREYHKKAASVKRLETFQWKIGVVSEIARTLVFEGKIEEASSYLLASNIAKFENVRSSLKGNIESQLKIRYLTSMFLNTAFHASALFCSRNNCVKGLHVVELGRARALADSMSCSSVLRKKRSIC